MADDYNISYSFNIGGDGDAPAEFSPQGNAAPVIADPLYAFDDCESFNLPSGVLLVNRHTGVRLTVTREVSAALQYCTRFRSLAEHANALVALMPELEGNVEGTRQVLAMVRDAGLMLSAEEVCGRFAKNEVAQEQPAPSRVFIITCDRPAAVERLLDSMLEKADLSPHEGCYLVDDSRDSFNAQANREAVERFNLSSGLRMTYFGAAQQRALLDSLVKRLPEQESAIRFIMDRERWADYKTYGLSRTLCLLLSVGYRCIIADDDVICTALYSPRKEEGVQFGDSSCEADFYSDSAQWQHTATGVGEDPLLGHTRCLGRGLAGALQAQGIDTVEQDRFKGASGRQLRNVHAGSPVLVTQCGTYGDPGSVDNSWLINIDAASRERMLQAPEGLRSALASRQCWLGQPRLHIFARAIMSQVTGLDNSRILPPYFPAFRGEDQLFGAMLEFLYPDAVVLEYPWAVPHLPLEERRGNPEGDSTVPRGNIQFCAAYLLERVPDDPGLPFELRLQGLCQVLDEMAASDDTVIRSVFRQKLTRAQALAIQKISDQVEESGQQSQEWLAYLQRCLQDNVGALQASPGLAGIPAIPPGMDENTVARRIREFAGGYSAALRAWPAIRAAAESAASGLA